MYATYIAVIRVEDTIVLSENEQDVVGGIHCVRERNRGRIRPLRTLIGACIASALA